MIAKAQKAKEKNYTSQVLVLSPAFDTIIREKLVVILETIRHKDELKLVKFLLKNTKLQINMSDIEPTTFNTNTGSPQGDGLREVLFNIYFKDTFRKLTEELNKISPKLLTTISRQYPPNERQYVDSADFITKDE